MDAATIALLVFIITYVLIVTEKIHIAVSAMIGAAALIFAGVLTQEKAISYIDWNTLGLLVGMMIVVGIMRETGVFEYLALKSVQLAKGEPIIILIALATVTAVVSAFLDNVTTVLLIAPVTITITKKLGLKPTPFLIAQILASNIGGTATLIGDPPNIMIGSQTGLGFMDFLTNLGPVVLIVLVATLLVFYFLYRKKLQIPDEVKRAISAVNPRDEIKDYLLLKKSLFVLVLIVVAFVLHQSLHLESATIALSGATLLMLLAGEKTEEVFLTVEWPTLFFFLGLFIVVGGLVETGIINALAQWSLNMTAGDMRFTGVFILWSSAIASAFINNVPFIATMIPLVQQMGTLGGISPAELEPIWWALALGACLGGNGTIIGASANVIVAGMADKSGNPIRFLEYMKLAFPLMLMSIAISTVYILVRYF